MQEIFDKLIDSFITNKIGIADGFLTPGLAGKLKANLSRLYATDQLGHAGTGNAVEVAHNKTVRGDMICWLDRAHGNADENEFLDIMDSFVLYLNNTCYTGITGYEFHYALYDTGSFYTRHLDQFRNNDSRQYSMIIYLNEDWTIADGGELCIHHAGHQQHIAPESGKSIFFKSSELLHEVLLTHKPRMSITGWLKK